MALTRDSSLSTVERVKRDPTFAKARLVLRDLVNGTVGFERLATATGKPSKSLHRMLSTKGNPSMDNLAIIIGVLRKQLGVKLTSRAVNAA